MQGDIPAPPEGCPDELLAIEDADPMAPSREQLFAEFLGELANEAGEVGASDAEGSDVQVYRCHWNGYPVFPQV